MKKIPLNATANQSLSFSVDGKFWEIHIFQAIDHMYVDINIDGETMVRGSRCVGGEFLLPYDHLWKESSGNLVFDEEPDWELFEDSCNLYYMTNAEARQFKEATK